MALPIGSGGSETNRRGAELLCRLHQQCEMDNIRLQARAAEGKFEVEQNLAVVVRELSDLVPDGRYFFASVLPHGQFGKKSTGSSFVASMSSLGAPLTSHAGFWIPPERFENLVSPSLKST